MHSFLRQPVKSHSVALLSTAVRPAQTSTQLRVTKSNRTYSITLGTSKTGRACNTVSEIRQLRDDGTYQAVNFFELLTNAFPCSLHKSVLLNST